MEIVSFISCGDRMTAAYFPPANQGHVNPAITSEETHSAQTSSFTGVAPEESNSRAPALVLVHGAIEYKENFYEFARLCAAAGYGVLVPDMHGHGESEGARFHVRMEQWVPDLQAAIRWLEEKSGVDGQRIGAFGFSSGGTAVLEGVLAGLPLKALVTLDATVRPILSLPELWLFRALGSIGGLMERWLGKELRLPLYRFAISQPVACDDAINEKFRNDESLRQGYGAYPVPGANQSFDCNTLQRVGVIDKPVLVMHGMQDLIDKPETARLLFDALGGEKELLLLPDSGHVGHLDKQKEEVFSRALSWFSRYL